MAKPTRQEYLKQQAAKLPPAQQKAGVCAVNSIISELRANGYSIDCQRRADKWFYRMNK